jgi:F-type H+-transporting ATPase subunit b
MMHGYAHFWLDPKFWVAVSFVLFFVLFGRKVFSALMGALDKRAEGISAQLNEAAQLRAEAEAMLKAAEAERAAAMKEAEELLLRAKAEAERVAAAAQAEAQAAAERRERMAMDRIAAAEAGAIAEVRQAAADIATAATRSLLAEAIDPATDAALIEKGVAELGKALRAA